MAKPPTGKKEVENGGRGHEEGLYDKDFLITEYEQAGEEFRYRDRLLHNSYYLLIVAVLAILTKIPNPSEDPFIFGVTLVIGGVVFSFLGILIWKHVNERNSAGALRNRAEQYAEGIRYDSVKRPLSIQFWVIGNNTRMDQKTMETRSFRDELKTLTTSEGFFSAKTIALIVFVLGLVQFLSGVCFLF